MARLVLCVLALLASGLANPVKKQKFAGPEFLQHQVDVLNLFYHIHEPIHEPELQVIVDTWDLNANVEHFNNHTAVKLYYDVVKNDMILPRGVPFSVSEPTHIFEARILFDVFYSAKDFDTFYKVAVYLRNRVNEGLYVYVLSVALLLRPDSQGIVVPPIYEIFPSFFHNAEIMATAQRINTHGKRMVEYYPSTYVWDDNVVIRWNSTSWPYYYDDIPISYYTHDVTINALYYNVHLMYPFWLGGETVPLIKDRRGELFWFYHRQIVARYYMERLSNGLGEIPILGVDVVQPGYQPEISYYNGIQFPVRPNHFHLDQPEFVEALTKIMDYEHRVREVIDQGYIVNEIGEHVNIRNPEAIDVLGRLIEANVDSPNPQYYKDFISMWYQVLGNSVGYKKQYYKDVIPLVVPSVLEHYQTALRDPAFYMIWKRVLGLFSDWQKKLPLYKVEELKVPSVEIRSVEVDKLVTYFEHSYYNVSNHLYMNERESKAVVDEVSVLVQRPQLNHKVFTFRVNVSSEVAKSVVVKFFLAPKYDSKGYEIPLHENYENFFLFDQFVYDLPVGDSVIKRESTENFYGVRGWAPGYEVYEKAYNALHGQGQFVQTSYEIDGIPDHLLLPKGRVGGMPFLVLVHISEYRPCKIPYQSNYDPTVSYGLGSGARYLTDEPFGYPLDRPLYQWQVDLTPNTYIQEVQIVHKKVPEVTVL
ncbi:acidic juvenile hormone-suppressible protein 1-like [Battus philenor]|uniref:acidic juvenile hormone-suppressible protein 1-like n=1 Tax=Battus philenor TaxID=42288 RepID=UPI0035D017E4